MADPTTGAPEWSLSDPHLNFVEPNEDEAARIGAVTALARNFSAPQQVEHKPTGAATARAMPTAGAGKCTAAQTLCKDASPFAE